MRAKKGALGVVTVLSEIYDLCLYIPETNIDEQEIMRWLKAGRIDTCFRKIEKIDSSLKQSLLTNSINVTITSDAKLADVAKDVTDTYYIKFRKKENIESGIQAVGSWKEIIRNIATLAF